MVMSWKCSTFKLPIMLQLRCGGSSKKGARSTNLTPSCSCMAYLTARHLGSSKSISTHNSNTDPNACPTCLPPKVTKSGSETTEAPECLNQNSTPMKSTGITPSTIWSSMINLPLSKGFYRFPEKKKLSTLATLKARPSSYSEWEPTDTFTIKSLDLLV